MSLKRYVLGIDPSGSFHEGKGTTGIAAYDTQLKCFVGAHYITAKDYNTQEEYWGALLDFIQRYDKQVRGDLELVVEDYFLYAGCATQQINSRMETCQLLGALKIMCMSKNIPIIFQTAAQVKKRWANKILVFKDIIAVKGNRTSLKICGEYKPINRHILDAVRHVMHRVTFYKE